MSIQKVLEMADRFITLAESKRDDGTTIKTPHNLEFQDQRTRLAEFADHFSRSLRRVTSEMGSDLFTLKERRFDPKTFKAFGAVYQSLIDMFKGIQADKPYRAAEKLVSYVFDRPTRIVLENLDYLAKHHVQATNVDFAPSATLQHPQIRSIDALNKLAVELKEFMEKYPLIVPPGAINSEKQTQPPPAKNTNLFGPENTLQRDDKTKI